MSERTSYAPGTFSWADLTTNDADAAKRFYGELLGWEFDDFEVPGGGVYVMARKGGVSVAALSEDPDQRPHWNNYVTVASVDDAAQRAEQLGATILQAPFDVVTAGRMAVVQDPTGGTLAVWETRDNIGAGRVNEPGALTWNDLTTPDIETAKRFYGEWMGWRIEEIPQANGYHAIKNGDRSNGGMREDANMPPFWCPYFGVDDVEAAIQQVGDLGGQVHGGPVPVPSGRFAIVADPQGAVFAVLSGVYDD